MTTKDPISRLTRERPYLWRSAVALATELTGMLYLPKMPLPDGGLFACGHVYDDRTDAQKKAQKEKFLKELEEDNDRVKRGEEPEIGRWEQGGHWKPFNQEQRDREIAIVRRDLGLKLSALVPDGAMEWLLHEAGHWLAATPEERALPNYGLTMAEHGHDGDREWQAWAFEEIILAPWGPARTFAPVTQRDGAAFAKAGPMPASALWHAERQLRAAHVDVERWRAVYGEWVQWGDGRWDGAI